MTAKDLMLCIEEVKFKNCQFVVRAMLLNVIVVEVEIAHAAPAH